MGWFILACILYSYAPAQHLHLHLWHGINLYVFTHQQQTIIDFCTQFCVLITKKKKKTLKAPIYNQFTAEVTRFLNDMQQLDKHIFARKVYGLVPDTVKMLLLKLFTSKHDGKTVR